jgi:hypothetical protein
VSNLFPLLTFLTGAEIGSFTCASRLRLKIGFRDVIRLGFGMPRLLATCFNMAEGQRVLPHDPAELIQVLH